LNHEVYRKSGFNRAELSVALGNRRRTHLVKVDNENYTIRLTPVGAETFTLMGVGLTRFPHLTLGDRLAAQLGPRGATSEIAPYSPQ